MNRALSIVLLLVFAAAARAQSVVELRPWARVSPGVPVTLGQVASLSGLEALALAGVSLTPVVTQPGGSPQITLEAVRAAIDADAAATKIKINWGRLTLRGGTCTLNPAGASEAKPAPTKSAEPPAIPAVGSVRAAVVARVAQLLALSPEEVRATFDASDADILDRVMGERTLEVRAAGESDRMPLALTLFEGDRTVASKTVRVSVQVRRAVLIARSTIRKGEPVDGASLDTDSRWLPPSATPASAEQATGATAQARIAAGDVVMAEAVAPTVAVVKGDIVAIRCVSGTIVLSTRARSMATGRDGELVQFQALDSKRTFFARMDGKGHATVVAGDAVPADSRRPAPARSAPTLPSRALEAVR